MFFNFLLLATTYLHLNHYFLFYFWHQTSCLSTCRMLRKSKLGRLNFIFFKRRVLILNSLKVVYRFRRKWLSFLYRVKEVLVQALKTRVWHFSLIMAGVGLILLNALLTSYISTKKSFIEIGPTAFSWKFLSLMAA